LAVALFLLRVGRARVSRYEKRRPEAAAQGGGPTLGPKSSVSPLVRCTCGARCSAECSTCSIFKFHRGDARCGRMSALYTAACACQSCIDRLCRAACACRRRWPHCSIAESAAPSTTTHWLHSAAQHDKTHGSPTHASCSRASGYRAVQRDSITRTTLPHANARL